MRPLRYIPPTDRGRTMVEVTARTIQSRALLRPTSVLNRTYYGVLARAQQITETQIHAFCALSTHHHLLLSVRDAQELARFMCHVQGNLSREIGKLNDWRGPFWERRYRGIVVAEEEEAQLSRFVYILDQGCSKDGLVASPLDWPGPSTAWALYNGEASIQGDWLDRTALYRARRTRPREDVEERDFLERLDITLTPLPAWSHLERAQRIERVRSLVTAIEENVRLKHENAGTKPLGAAVVRARHPHSRPAKLNRTPAPRFHAKSAAHYRSLVDAYNLVLSAYRSAAAELRAGNLTVSFPEGCFPPPRAFIPGAASA